MCTFLSLFNNTLLGRIKYLTLFILQGNKFPHMQDAHSIFGANYNWIIKIVMFQKVTNESNYFFHILKARHNLIGLFVEFMKLCLIPVKPVFYIILLCNL